MGSAGSPYLSELFRGNGDDFLQARRGWRPNRRGSHWPEPQESKRRRVVELVQQPVRDDACSVSARGDKGYYERTRNLNLHGAIKERDPFRYQ